MGREIHEGEGTYIRAWSALFALFVLALAVSGYVQFANRGAFELYSWDISAGLIIGGALFLVALPAIVIIPWRLIQRHSGTITDMPVMFGGAVFFLCAILLLNGAAMD